MLWLFASIVASALWIAAESYECDVVETPYGVTPVGVCLLANDGDDWGLVSKKWVCSADDSTAYEFVYGSQDCSGEPLRGSSIAAAELYVGWANAVCGTGATCAYATLRNWDYVTGTDVPCDNYDVQSGDPVSDYAVILGNCIPTEYATYLPSCNDAGDFQYTTYASEEDCWSRQSPGQVSPFAPQCYSATADEGAKKETLAGVSCAETASSATFNAPSVPYSETCDSLVLNFVRTEGAESTSFTRVMPVGVCLDKMEGGELSSNQITCDGEGVAYYNEYAGGGCQGTQTLSLTAEQAVAAFSDESQSIELADQHCNTGNTCNYAVLRKIRAQNATMTPVDCETATAGADDDYEDEATIIDMCVGGTYSGTDGEGQPMTIPVSEFTVCDSATSSAMRYQVWGSDECELVSWESSQASEGDVLSCESDSGDGVYSQKQVMLSIQCNTPYPTLAPTTGAPTTANPTRAPIDYGCNYAELQEWYIEEADGYILQRFPTGVCLEKMEDGQLSYMMQVCRDDDEIYITEFAGDVADCGGAVTSSLPTSMLPIFAPELGEVEVSETCGKPNTCKYGKVREYKNLQSPVGDCAEAVDATADYEDRAYVIDPCDQLVHSSGAVSASTEFMCVADTGLKQIVYTDGGCSEGAQVLSTAAASDGNYQCDMDANERIDLVEVSCELTDAPPDPPALPQPSFVTSLDCDYVELNPPSEGDSWQMMRAWPIGVCTKRTEDGVETQSSQMLCVDGAPVYNEYEAVGDCSGDATTTYTIEEAEVIGVVFGDMACDTGNACDYVVMAHVHSNSDGTAVDCEADTQPVAGENFEEEAILLGHCLPGSVIVDEDGTTVTISQVFYMDLTGDTPMVSQTVFFNSDDCSGYALHAASGAIGGILGDCPGDDDGKEVILSSEFSTPSPTAATAAPTTADGGASADDGNASSAVNVHYLVVMFMAFGFLFFL